MAPTNKAAFYPSDKAPTLQVASSPYPTAGPNDVIVHVAAAAINSVDWKIQEAGTAVFPFLQYPLVGGLDVAGTVVEVGPAVSKFRPGDRVLGFSSDFVSRAGGFQNYVVVPASVVTHLPENTPFVDAAVLPSGVATAAVSLYQYLDLTHPSLPARPGNGQTVLITAGASSVGSNAIQLAVASGYEVITTASPRHFAHCTALGASRVFDYHSSTLLEDVKAAFRGKQCAGGLSSVESSNSLAFEVVSASEGEGKSVACTILFSQDGVPANIRTEMIHAFHIKDTPLADVVFGTYLPAALAGGRYKCEPKPRVVGTSLESVQTALDIGKTNAVSCEKLVVTLAGGA
ncbi:GroES-like protein [Xylaria digitata]|nr:GroES-like protein [Xylaria digitata]